MSNLIDILKQDLEEIGVIFPLTTSSEYNEFIDDLLVDLANGDVLYFDFKVCESKIKNFENNLKTLLDLHYEHIETVVDSKDEKFDCIFKYRDKFYTVSYYYYSYEGYDYEGIHITLKEVKQKQKSVIYYEWWRIWCFICYQVGSVIGLT